MKLLIQSMNYVLALNIYSVKNERLNYVYKYEID